MTTFILIWGITGFIPLEGVQCYALSPQQGRTGTGNVHLDSDPSLFMQHELRTFPGAFQEPRA